MDTTLLDYTYDNLTPTQFRWGNLLMYFIMLASVFVNGITTKLAKDVLKLELDSIFDFLNGHIERNWNILKDNLQIRNDSELMYLVIESIDLLYKEHVKKGNA